MVNGEPVNEPELLKWADWFETHREECRVSLTNLGRTRISTVFLGIDHSCFGPPQLFETMIFGLSADEEYMRRYATRAEAEAGHAEAVRYAQDRLNVMCSN